MKIGWSRGFELMEMLFIWKNV